MAVTVLGATTSHTEVKSYLGHKICKASKTITTHLISCWLRNNSGLDVMQ